MNVLYYCILFIALAAALSIVYFTWKNGIPPMPTTRYLCAQTEAVLAPILATDSHARPRQLVEAGSGWGTLAIYLGRRFPQLRIIGLENSPLPHLVAHLLKVILVRTNCVFYRKNVFSYDFKATEIVVCYLHAPAMRKLSIQLREQLPPGAIIISIFFALPDWQPLQTMQCNDLYRTKIYVYQKNNR